ncbi:MAG: PAS domain-containing protein [Microvirga sp.]|nr:PAS domain-containing protein [Beijerinckiaceae bacterium]
MGKIDPRANRAGSVSDVRLASVLETAADGIIIIDEHARMMMFNKACERMLADRPFAIMLRLLVQQEEHQGAVVARVGQVEVSRVHPEQARSARFGMK